MSTPTCPHCGTAHEGPLCPDTHRQEEHDDSLEASRRKLEETRAKLASWRDRLAHRVDEFQKRRDRLAAPESRLASRAPTIPLEEPGTAATVVTAASPYDATMRFGTSADEVFPGSAAATAADEGDIFYPPAAPPWALPDAAPANAADSETPNTHDTIAMGPGKSARATAAESPGDTPENPSYAYHGQLLRAPAHARPRVVGAEPSIVRRAAALLLDLILLFLLPAAALTLPAAASSEPGLAALWDTSGGLILTLVAVLFVLLETLFVGCVGRTPGQRMTGLEVADRDGQLPTFAAAALRALLFPARLVAPLERLLGTTTLAEE